MDLKTVELGGFWFRVFFGLERQRVCICLEMGEHSSGEQ